MASVNAVPLSDLTDRRIGVAWFEAVAIVRGLAETVAGGGPQAGVPPFDCIELLPDGTLQFYLAPDLEEHPVIALAGLLRDLLHGGGIPPELELFCLRNMHLPLPHSTTAAFADALSFFERPGRETVLAELFHRARPTVIAIELEREVERARRDAERAAMAEAELQAARSESTKPYLNRASISRIEDFVALTVLSLILFVVFVRLPRVQAALPNPPAPAAFARTSEPLAANDAPVDAPVLIAPENRPQVAGRPSNSAAQRPTTNVRPRAEGARFTDSTAGGTSPPPEKSAADATPRERTAAPPGDGVPLPTDAAAGIERITVYVPTVVYTEDDADVKPPVFVRRHVPEELRSGLQREKAGILELIVSESGTVEHVRLLSPTNRYQDRMLVAAAKAWLFQPAVKDDMPVKYLIRVRITS
jgi:hypothetical protein